ncbi:MAG: hypothetical protein R6U32_06685 [Candidatus Woesearchaeota archaeon]
MAIVGFNFTKINGEKKEAPKGKINVKNNVEIKSVEKTDLSLGSSKQKGLKIKFEFKSVYDPKVGEILLAGEVFDLEEEKIIQDVLKKWKSDKKLPDDMTKLVVNAILSRSNIQALVISKELALPPPIPLPKVGQQPVKQG